MAVTECNALIWVQNWRSHWQQSAPYGPLPPFFLDNHPPPTQMCGSRKSLGPCHWLKRQNPPLDGWRLLKESGQRIFRRSDWFNFIAALWILNQDWMCEPAHVSLWVHSDSQQILIISMDDIDGSNLCLTRRNWSSCLDEALVLLISLRWWMLHQSYSLWSLMLPHWGPSQAETAARDKHYFFLFRLASQQPFETASNWLRWSTHCVSPTLGGN